MGSAVLRAAGTTFDAVEFAAAHALECDRVWRVGDIDRRGRVATDAGFSLLVAEASTPSDLVSACSVWLREREAMMTALAAAGAEPRLDVALCLSPARPSRSVTFGTKALELCVQLGLALEVSADGTSAESGDAV